MDIPADSIASWLRIAALLDGAAGLSLLLPALIGRIPEKVPRRTAGCITGVAAAAAVPYFGLMLLSQPLARSELVTP